MFLSHTSELRSYPEGRSYVDAAEAAVIRAGHAVIDMAYFAARDSRPSDSCRQMVVRADVYVGIIGVHYGSPVPDRPDRSYTELEFEAATDRRLPRLVFVIDERAEPPVMQSREHRARQDSFRQRLVEEAELTVRWVSSPTDLEVGLVHALGELGGMPDDLTEPPEPGAGIPPEPTAYFVGREAELTEVRRRLRQRGRVIVHGLGGIGKTQLTARFAHDERREYPDGVFWLRAHQEVSLVGDLASLGWRLRLPEREQRALERQVAAVLRWLREHPRWLLVLDNLEPEVGEAVRYWLPANLPGHVLATSRTPIWPARLGLKPLRHDVASRFLLERTGQADDAAASAVAEILWGLPLALEQAAAYLDTCGRDLGSYASLLRTRLVELLAQGRPEDYPRTVATTLRLSVDRIDSEQPEAAALLRLCAFLAPTDIPVRALQTGAGEVPEELRSALMDDLQLDRTVAGLRRYSLIEREGDGLHVHPLVQAVIRESLSPELSRKWGSAAVRLLSAGLPEDAHNHPEHWPLCARLVPHARAVEQYAAAQVSPLTLAALLDRVGLYLFGRGELGAARACCERALGVRERAQGPEHPDTAEALGRLANVLKEQGLLDAAAPLLGRALAVRERVLGQDHLVTALGYHDMAELLHARGDVATARQLNVRALSVREKRLGPDHTETAHSLHNQAWILLDDGEPAAARSLLERALAIREGTLGPDHPHTVWSLHLLALILRASGDSSAARPLLEHVVSVRERVLGPTHHEVGWALHDLAALLRDLGETAVARSLFERALTIRSGSLGSAHRLTAQSRRSLTDITAKLKPEATGPIDAECEHPYPT